MNTLSDKDLKSAFLEKRHASYIRLKGGFPIPLAGALYWLALSAAGTQLDIAAWSQFAFYGSGAIFPLALLLAKIFNNKFMSDKNIASSVLPPCFISMLLFWPIIIAAAQVETELISLILAIGLSLHWPVIGWSYGRSALFSAHSILRAIIVLFIWMKFPGERLTWLPFSISIIYIATIFAILWDVRSLHRKNSL